MCGKADCDPAERGLGADLGLFSVTYNNDTQLDAAMLRSYKEFRLEAEQKSFRHFLEVFPPNAPQAAIADLGQFINDNIARTLAGVAGSGRPLFLKVPYNGPAAMEQLVSYDRNLVVGILGGSSGTTFDAFHQLYEAKKYGARVALYGRMINNSEHQASFIEHLRFLADGEITDPAEAVRSYHAALQKLNIAPYRAIDEDLVQSMRQSAYGGSSKTASVPSRAGNSDKSGAAESADGKSPDFANMTAQEKLAWNRRRLDRMLGD
jgi:hypothetical protein